MTVIGKCAICLDNDNEREWQRVQHGGDSVSHEGHDFHRECIETWISAQQSPGHTPTCPLCRRAIVQLRDRPLIEITDSDEKKIYIFCGLSIYLFIMLCFILRQSGF